MKDMIRKICTLRVDEEQCPLVEPFQYGGRLTKAEEVLNENIFSGERGTGSRDSGSKSLKSLKKIPQTNKRHWILTPVIEAVNNCQGAPRELSCLEELPRPA